MSDHSDMDEPDAELVAAEYALGVLDEAARSDAERRRAAEPAFAREVQSWEARLAPLAAEIAEHAAPASVWTGVQRRIQAGPPAANTDSAHGANVVELRLRRSLTVWRSLATAAGALAAVLAAAVVWPRPQPALSPFLTARLVGKQGPVAFVAVFDPARREILLTPATITALQGRSPELWLIPTGGKPVAIGVATFEHAVRLVPGAGLGGQGQVTLAVSIEPLGGSPTGQPTGPVVATGQLQGI